MLQPSSSREPHRVCDERKLVVGSQHTREDWQEVVFRTDLIMQHHVDKMAVQMQELMEYSHANQTALKQAVNSILTDQLAKMEASIKGLTRVSEKAISTALESLWGEHDSASRSQQQCRQQQSEIILEVRDLFSKMVTELQATRNRETMKHNFVDFAVQVKFPDTPRRAAPSVQTETAGECKEPEVNLPRLDDTVDFCNRDSLVPRLDNHKAIVGTSSSSVSVGCNKSEGQGSTVSSLRSGAVANGDQDDDHHACFTQIAKKVHHRLDRMTYGDTETPASHAQLVADDTFSIAHSHTLVKGGIGSRRVQQLDTIFKLLQNRALHKVFKKRLRTSESCSFVEHSRLCMLFTLVSNSFTFNCFCSVMTLAFAVMIGFEADSGVRAALKGETNSNWVSSVCNGFNLWFIFEVIIRIFGHRVQYIIGPDWRWNLLDFCLVVLSVLDLIGESGSVGFIRLLRGLKAVRAARVVRILRLFRELRVMSGSMLASVASLFWSFVFLALIIYMFAVAFLQGAETYLRNTSTQDAIADGLRMHFPNGLHAMYSLIACITEGIDWTTVASPVWGLNKYYGLGMVFFVLLSVLGILNVVTSIFVERATNMKRLDREFAISEEIRAMETDIHDTIHLFRKLDPDGTGRFKISELREYLRDEHVIAHFASLGIDATNAKLFAQLFDRSNTGYVTVESFVMNFMSLKGSAKQTSMIAIAMEVRKLQVAIEQLDKDVQALPRLKK